jgi:hypothetical protein
MTPRHRILLLAAAFAALAGPAAAKDSLKLSMTNPMTVDTPFADCTSSGSVTLAGTKISLKMKKLAQIADGDGMACSDDEVICTVASTNSAVGDTTVVMKADVKNGAVVMKHDLCKEMPALCPMTTTSFYATRVVCYEADAAFDPMFTVPLPSGCEGVVIGPFTAPASAEIAEDGQTSCP